jgi:hypothetical protein
LKFLKAVLRDISIPDKKISALIACRNSAPVASCFNRRKYSVASLVAAHLVDDAGMDAAVGDFEPEFA